MKNDANYSEKDLEKKFKKSNFTKIIIKSNNLLCNAKRLINKLFCESKSSDSNAVIQATRF